MNKRDEYSAARQYEHSTLGDSAKRYHRDTDAFTAGAQYALDRLVSRIDNNNIGVWSDYLLASAAEILGNVHTLTSAVFDKPAHAENAHAGASKRHPENEYVLCEIREIP